MERLRWLTAHWKKFELAYWLRCFRGWLSELWELNWWTAQSTMNMPTMNSKANHKVCKYCTFATVCTSRYILWQKYSHRSTSRGPGFDTRILNLVYQGLCQWEMHENALVALPTYVARNKLKELAVATGTLAQFKRIVASTFWVKWTQLPLQM